MAVYLKKFENHTQYENYINGSDAILPNVSICTTEGDVYYNPYVEPLETRVVVKYNVTDTSNPTKLYYGFLESQFSEIEIDDVKQQSVVSEYTFNTTGEHTVKYTLADPTSISNWAFLGCSGITSIDIPNSVTSIGSNAFDGCSGLTSVVIPDSVTSIGYQVFEGCSSLTSIICNATTAPTIQTSTFSNVNTGGTLTVPQGSTGYDVWMGTGNYYLGKYNWTKVEQ